MHKKLTQFLPVLFASMLATPSQAQCFHTICPTGTQVTCDYTDNHPFLWHAADWWDPATQLHDLSDALAELALPVTDTCAEAPAVHFKLLLDLNGDTLPETLIDSDSLDQYPAGSVPFNNYPDATNREWRAFDNRPLPPGSQYRFALQTTVVNNIPTYRIAWNTTDAPLVFTPALLPNGRHQVKWTIESVGSPADSCQYNLELRDCKNPILVCSNGLTANLMPTKQITLLASDFLLYAEDNYTPADQLQLGIRRSGTGTGFPLNPDGTPADAITFTCDDLGSHPVELWARDLAGNADYCETFLFLQDPWGFCDSLNAPQQVTFCLTHCDMPFPIVVGYDLNTSPPFTGYSVPGNDGCSTILFPGTSVPGNYTVTPVRDNDPLNGVSTLDLVRIKQHILGLQPLDSPDKILAADVNKSGSISNLDLLDLQRLVLGINSEFPNSTSWRFVPGNFVFPNPANPFETQFPESIVIDSLNGDTFNFTGIKVGNVTCNTGLDFPAPPQHESLPDGAPFCVGIPKAGLQAGDTLLLPFTAADGGQLLGFQFDLYLASPLTLTDILPGPAMTLSDFAVFGPNTFHVSWSNALPRQWAVGEPLFYIKITAGEATSTESKFYFELDRIRPEGYNDAEEVQPFTVCYTQSVGVHESSGNLRVTIQPNPANDRAWLLTEPAPTMPVRLELFDLTGRLVLQKTAPASDAAQPIEIPVQTLLPGAYEYRVWIGANRVTGRLIKI